MTVRAFPVDLDAHPTFQDTFGAPRPQGRTHEGTDIFAPEGTAVFAVDSGRIEHQEGSIGGHTVVLHTEDRTRYVYSHLSAYEGKAPRKVVAGELVGRVGRTGNAASTRPHLHFEIHPDEGAPINPFEALRAALPSAQQPAGPPAPSSPGPSSSPAHAFAGVEGGLALIFLVWALTRGSRPRWSMN